MKLRKKSGVEFKNIQGVDSECSIFDEPGLDHLKIAEFGKNESKKGISLSRRHTY